MDTWETTVRTAASTMLRFPHKLSDGLEAELYALLETLGTATTTERSGDQIMDQQEKARRWDHLVELLKSPGLQDTYVFHLSKLRRATLMLLASPEELPGALATELNAYQARLDALYLEAADGFTDLEGILNAIPALAIGSAVGELSQPGTGG
jgi:hypothetical protein